MSAIRDDADGLPQASSFLYQWLRVSGANETPIQNADARTYRLEAADAGAKFKVRVSFTDLDGHPEARTSDAWPATTVAANAAPTAAAKTVRLDEDTTHTFSAADFGFQDADPGDALASLRIAARPAAGTLALGGTPVTDNQEIAAAQLGQLVFTPPPDANGAGYASFTFKVGDGTDESALSYTITLDVTAVNDPATGLPTISGTARVGQTLTADVSAIRDDADGLPAPASFLYQWLRVSGANETPILNADARTYRLASADAGAKFKVRVSFTDLDGHPEARTSDAWPTQQTVLVNTAPTGVGKTVTLDEDDSHPFSEADFGYRDGDGDALASVRITVLPAAGSLTLDGNGVQANGTVTKTQLDAGDLVYTPPPDANGAGYASFTFRVSDGTDESALAYTITLDVDAVNDPATGLPTISGTARVGQTLTADVSAIRDDADGLPQASSFLYQWLRVSGANETPILNADARTYRLASADAGAKFKVRVSFTDLDGHPEARTSDAWPAQQTVLVNTAPTGASKTIGLAEDGFHPFSEADFGYRDGDGDALASVTIATLPAQGKGALALGGTPVTANQEIAAAQLGQLVFAPPPDANGAGYASFTFRVSDGTDESALAYTITLDVDAVNDPATGAPTISGTERVGHVLTADVSAIEDDADGLPAPASFLYQWLRVSGGNETPIQGASASTYRLEAADAGAKFKVRVSFTDLDGHPEARTSDAWPTQQTVLVNTAPTGASKTIGLAEDGFHPFSEADFGYRDGDGDALASVTIATLPAQGKGTLALGGTPVTDNQEIAAAQLGQLVFAPPPDANGAGYASFTFRVSDGTDESALAYTITLDVTAVNDPATGLPTISGTARVGQTLTADVSAIRDDADGLPRPPASSTSGCASRAPTRRRS